MKIEGEMARAAGIAEVFAAVGQPARIVPIGDDRFMAVLERPERLAANPSSALTSPAERIAPPSGSVATLCIDPWLLAGSCQPLQIEVGDFAKGAQIELGVCLSGARVAVKERLEAVTGERISALEGIGEDVRREGKAGREAAPEGRERERDRHEGPAVRRIEAARERDAKAAREKAAPVGNRAAPSAPDREVGRDAPQRKTPEPELPAKTRVREMDLGM